MSWKIEAGFLWLMSSLTLKKAKNPQSELSLVLDESPSPWVENKGWEGDQ